MCTLCAEFAPWETECPYLAPLPDDEAGEAVSSSLPVYSYDQIADQLTSGYWGGSTYAFDVAPGGTLTVDVAGLTEDGQEMARLALKAWGEVTGIAFAEVADVAASATVTESGDAAPGTATAETMAVGEDFAGTIGAPGDRDSVALSLIGGERITLRVTSDDAGGTLLDGIDSELKTERVANPHLPTDSAPFYSAGVPVLALFTGLHDDYHTPADTVDKIDFDGLAKVSNYLQAVTSATANLDAAPDYVKVERRRNRSRVLLGIRMQDAPDAAGSKVLQVVPDSPAEKAGIEDGDVIVSLDGKEVKDNQSLQAILNKLQPEKEIPMKVQRGEERRDLKITPAKR